MKRKWVSQEQFPFVQFITSEGIVIFECNFLLSTENSYFCSGLGLDHLTVFLLRIDLTESFLSNLGKLFNETVINNGQWSDEMYSCKTLSPEMIL